MKQRSEQKTSLSRAKVRQINYISAYSAEPYDMLKNAASYQGLHCLLP